MADVEVPAESPNAILCPSGRLSSEDGWINMEDALAYVNREGDSHTAADIRKVIGADTKGRYAMRFNPFASEDEHPDTALQIRANQGHTMEGVVPYLKRVDPEQVPTAVEGDSSGVAQAFGNFLPVKNKLLS